MKTVKIRNARMNKIDLDSDLSLELRENEEIIGITTSESFVHVWIAEQITEPIPPDPLKVRVVEAPRIGR